MKLTIEKRGYMPVQCDKPLPCPFCGSEPTLSQLAHTTTSRRVGKKWETVRICIAYSSQTLQADTFKFNCDNCKATTGRYHDTAQGAVEAWNTRYTPPATDQPQQEQNQ